MVWFIGKIYLVTPLSAYVNMVSISESFNNALAFMA